MTSAMLILVAWLVSQDTEPPRVMPVTLQQCIYLAERNSIPLRIDEVAVQIAEAEIGRELGTFDTVAFFDGSYQKDIRPTASALEAGTLGPFGSDGSSAGSPEIIVTGITTDSWQINTGFRGMLLNGASYQADVDWSKVETTAGTFGGFNPEYRSGIGVSFTQPLLRGYGTTVNKAPVLQAQNRLLGAAENLETSRVLRASEVIRAYWEYFFSFRTLETRDFLVGQAERLVEINSKKLEVGDARRIDVIEAESELASRQQEQITAENDIGRTADELKRLIFPFEDQEEWDAELVPITAEAEAAVEPPAWRAAATRALERRPELRRLRELLENNDLRILVAENAVLPRFDLNASLRFNQLAGSKGQVLNYDDDFYSIGAGVSVEVPLGNRFARYDLSIVRLQKIQALLEYKDVENQVIQEVRDGVREVANRKKEIDAAREAVRLAAERWSSEQKRQEVGFSTTFQVREAQAQWREAKDAETRALFEYQIALAALDQAQGTLLERYGILPAPQPRLEDRAGVHFDS